MVLSHSALVTENKQSYICTQRSAANMSTWPEQVLANQACSIHHSHPVQQIIGHSARVLLIGAHSDAYLGIFAFLPIGRFDPTQDVWQHRAPRQSL